MSPGLGAVRSWWTALKLEPTLWPSLASSLIHSTFLCLGFPIRKIRIVTGPHQRETVQQRRDDMCQGLVQGLTHRRAQECWNGHHHGTPAPSARVGDWGKLQRDPGEMTAIVRNVMGCQMVRVDKWGPTLENLGTRRNLREGQA